MRKTTTTKYCNDNNRVVAERRPVFEAEILDKQGIIFCSPNPGPKLSPWLPKSPYSFQHPEYFESRARWLP